MKNVREVISVSQKRIPKIDKQERQVLTSATSKRLDLNHAKFHISIQKSYITMIYQDIQSLISVMIALLLSRLRSQLFSQTK